MKSLDQCIKAAEKMAWEARMRREGILERESRRVSANYAGPIGGLILSFVVLMVVRTLAGSDAAWWAVMAMMGVGAMVLIRYWWVNR